MAIHDSAASEEPAQTARPPSRLFALRIWTEDVAGGSEFRGSVRDTTTGAYRGFRDWSDLIDFLVARMEDEALAEDEPAEGDRTWSSRTTR
jgi:hypothetical protein